MAEGALKYQYDVSDPLLAEMFQYPEVRDKFYNNTHFRAEDGTLLQLRGGAPEEITPKSIWEIGRAHV